MEEKDEIKIQQHILRVVKQSGVPINVEFVKKTATNSVGCFKGDVFEIEFSIPHLYYQFEHQKTLGTIFPSILHLADLVISHELGHAKDQLERNFVTQLQYIKNMIWRKADLSQRRALKHYCREYKTCNQEVEEIAWQLAPTFTLLTHDEIVVRRYVDYCLKSYKDLYPYYFKMHAHALHLMEQWRKELISPLIQTCNYDMLGQSITHYELKLDQLNIYIPTLLRAKPKKLTISPNHYLFFQTLYIIAKTKYVDNELESKIGDILISIKRKGYSAEDRKELERLTQKKREDTEKAFAFIERHLTTISSSYLSFKAYRLNELEEDLKDNFEFIQERIEKTQKKKIAN